MPAVFFGHGNPMNALLRNPYTEQWTEIGTRLPRPKAILCLSAHWYIQDAAVTVSTTRVGAGHIMGGVRLLLDGARHQGGDAEIQDGPERN